MITLIFMILFIAVFGKLAIFALKAAWGIAKVLTFLVFLPIIIVVCALSGLIYLGIIALIVVGIVSLIKSVVA